MTEFVQIGHIANASVFSPKFINCEKHGQHVKACLNGDCEECMKEREKAKNKKEFNAYIKRKKIEAGISEKFLNATFENYQIKNENQQKVYSAICEYNLKGNLLLTGKTGTGKTHLACALIDKFLRDYKSCYYAKFYQLAKIQVQDKKLFEEILKVDFLVIDEYGVSDTDYKTNLLFEVIDQRYDQILPSMLMSNLDIETFKSKLSNALYSRIKEDCIVKVCNWDDFRLRGAA